MTEKFCNACKTTKCLEEDFGKDSWAPSGYTDYCRECRNSRARRYAAKTGLYKTRNAKLAEYKIGYYKRPEVVARMRDQWFRKQYGISLKEYDALLKKQGRKCAVCSAKSGETRIKRLAVDHCHETNVVRGLLCQRCNRAIGLLGDDRAILEKAIVYLSRAPFKLIQDRK